jgi:hypothetical protein
MVLGSRAGHHKRVPKNGLFEEYFLYLNIQTKSFDSSLGYVQGRPPLGQRRFIESTLLEGQASSSPWWWCLLVVYVVVD